MKRTTFAAASIILAVVALLTYSTKADAQLLWPVKGAEPGEGIICKPQQYIGSELNFDDLFITAEEGTEVVSPCDGTLLNYIIDQQTSLITIYTSHMPELTFDEGISEVIKENKLKVPSKYVCGSLGIRMNDGRILYISGLTGNVRLKTGMKIGKGDLLGKVGYAFKEFEEPHISLSISTPGGKTGDPMTPFGLETTFVAPGKMALPETLTSEQAQEDFTVLMDAYQEVFPSLDEIVTKEQFDVFRNEGMKMLEKEISYVDFYNLARRTTSAELVHDSHVALLTRDPRMGDDRRALYSPNLMLGIIKDTLFVTMASIGCKDMVGRKVAFLDGVPAAEVIERTEKMLTGYDGENESYREYLKLMAWNYIYGNEVTKPRTSTVRFDDGTEYVDVWMDSRKARYTPARSTRLGYYKRMYAAMDKSWEYESLNDSTGLLSIHTFALNEVEVDAIADTIRAESGKANMIIDVRFNDGGHIDPMNRLLSLFMDKPSIDLESYQKVNSDSTFKSFRYSANYTADMNPFADFVMKNGKEGYYKDSDIYYHSSDNELGNSYKGRLYILTDETSVSAATYFPAYLVRNHRAVTVGRETKTGYHYMTAIKFADIMLPNSKIQVRIPMVKDVFDDVVTPRTPSGRGLLPDYEVPLTYEELFTAENDPVLDKALELIAEGKYLEENPFAVIEHDRKLGRIALAAGGIGLIALMVLGYRKRG